MTRRKKKSSKEEKKFVIEELDGFKLNDDVWAEYLDGKIIQGRIVNFLNTEPDGNIACLMTANRGYRTVLLEKCSLTIIKKRKVNK
jgi:hypothetical protein